MTSHRPDPFLAEVAKVLPDVDVVAIPRPDPDRVPAPLDGVDAERASRMAVDDLVDTLAGMWEICFPATPPPAQVWMQWFTHPSGHPRLVMPQAWVRHRLDRPVREVAAGAADLEVRGWTVSRDETPHGERLRAVNGDIHAELQLRTGGLMLLRAQHGYLSLGGLGSQLVGRGTDERAWP